MARLACTSHHRLRLNEAIRRSNVIVAAKNSTFLRGADRQEVHLAIVDEETSVE